jgi:hypothetical protein
MRKLKPVQRLTLKRAEAAIVIAREELPASATIQEIEDYAVDLMRQEEQQVLNRRRDA